MRGTPTAGDFGEPEKIIEVKPLVEPVPETFDPELEPAETPAVEPEREGVPA
jgi:hypothetical protein